MPRLARRARRPYGCQPARRPYGCGSSNGTGLRMRASTMVNIAMAMPTARARSGTAAMGRRTSTGGDATEGVAAVLRERGQPLRPHHATKSDTRVPRPPVLDIPLHATVVELIGDDDAADVLHAL